MHRTDPDIDIILDILNAMRKSNPASVFIQSLYEQYCERGSLSKKQLEGLHSKASKITGMHPGKMATLEAIIKKKPTRDKSEAPREMNTPIKDERTGQMINQILAKYPEHKRVLFFKARFDNNEIFSSQEITELEKFHKLLAD